PDPLPAPAFDSVLRKAGFDCHVLANPIVGGRQAVVERRVRGATGNVEIPNDRHRRPLLRPRHERPRRRRGAGERKEGGAVHGCARHSITSSAMASTVAGMSSPSTLAALILIVSWYFVGCWNGKSPGFSPRKIRST